MNYTKQQPSHLCVAVKPDGREVPVQAGTRNECERAAELLATWPGYAAVQVRELRTPTNTYGGQR